MSAEKPRFTEARVSFHVSFEVKDAEVSTYSHAKLLNIHVSDEPIAADVDPVKYIVSRLTEEIRRQAPLLRAQYPISAEGEEVLA